MVNKVETELERQLRLEKEKQKRELKKLEESPASRASRLEKRRQKLRDESPTSRASRLERQRQSNKKRPREKLRTSRASRLEKQRQRTKERRRNESPTSASRIEKQSQIDGARPTSRTSQIETDRLPHEARLHDESPTSSEARRSQQCQSDGARGNAELDITATVAALEAKDNIDGPKNCNDDRRNNIAEASNDFCNNNASGISTEYATILSDKEDYSNSTLSGEKPLLSHRVSNKPKASSTNLISDVDLNATIENLSDSSLGIPKKHVHGLDVSPSEPLGKYQCFLCPFNYAEKHHLSLHLLKHFNCRRPHMCPVCEKTFPLMCRLQTHINAWADISPYQCEQCNESFTTSWKLSKHKRNSHSGMSALKCAKCDYKTFERNHLNIHLAIHMDERPFKCNHCSYASKSKRNLTTHERIHKDDKRYKCDICYFCFVQPRALQNHRIKHFRNGLIIHRCKFCTAVLDSPDALREHVENFHRDEVLK